MRASCGGIFLGDAGGGVQFSSFAVQRFDLPVVRSIISSVQKHAVLWLMSTSVALGVRGGACSKEVLLLFRVFFFVVVAVFLVARPRSRCRGSGVGETVANYVHRWSR